jgi:Tripartite tricarboxylate transporter TctB family
MGRSVIMLMEVRHFASSQTSFGAAQFRRCIMHAADVVCASAAAWRVRKLPDQRRLFVGGVGELTDTAEAGSPRIRGSLSMSQPIPPAQLKPRSPQDFAGGVFLIIFGLFAWWLGSGLPTGTLRAMGPGMLPKAFALILAGLGALMVFQSMRAHGPALERWSIRGILLVLGGCILFGLMIRGFEIGPIKVPSLGLVVSGPLVVLVSGMAAPDKSWREIIIFAIVMTVFCGGLFKYVLGLPIPLAPWLIGV